MSVCPSVYGWGRSPPQEMLIRGFALFPRVNSTFLFSQLPDTPADHTRDHDDNTSQQCRTIDDDRTTATTTNMATINDDDEQEGISVFIHKPRFLKLKYCGMYYSLLAS